MIKKAISAAFVSVGLLVTVAPAAGAAAPQACNQGTMNAHDRVPPHAHQAHMSIPHCPMT
jgi:hypothetical protein